jgi:hypothetical protein
MSRRRRHEEEVSDAPRVSPAAAASSASAQAYSDPPASRKRPRIDDASARSPCYMDRCADVELQLILQMVENKERFMAARVNRRMLHAVSQPFSWRHAALFEVTYDSSLAERVQRSLVRMAPISLTRGYDDTSTPAEVAAVPNVHVLRQCTDGETAEFDLEYLALPAAQNLRGFLIDTDNEPYCFNTCALVVRLAARLPLLHTIELNCRDHGKRYLEPLSSAPALTHLKLYGPSTDDLVACPRSCRCANLSWDNCLCLDPASSHVCFQAVWQLRWNIWGCNSPMLGAQ